MSKIDIEWLLNRDETFRYQMLSRLKMDCDFFLGNAKFHEPHLWAGSVAGQIETMKALWNKFPEDAKPEWLTWEQIEKYERDMSDVVKWALAQDYHYRHEMLEKVYWELFRFLGPSKEEKPLLMCTNEKQLEFMKQLKLSLDEEANPPKICHNMFSIGIPTWDIINEYEIAILG